MYFCVQVQQPFDPASYYAQLYRSGADIDGRISPFHSTGISTKYNGNATMLLPQASQSSQEVTSRSSELFYFFIFITLSYFLAFCFNTLNLELSNPEISNTLFSFLAFKHREVLIYPSQASCSNPMTFPQPLEVLSLSIFLLLKSITCLTMRATSRLCITSPWYGNTF